MVNTKEVTACDMACDDCGRDLTLIITSRDGVTLTFGCEMPLIFWHARGKGERGE